MVYHKCRSFWLQLKFLNYRGKNLKNIFTPSQVGRYFIQELPQCSKESFPTADVAKRRSLSLKWDIVLKKHFVFSWWGSVTPLFSLVTTQCTCINFLPCEISTTEAVKVLFHPAFWFFVLDWINFWQWHTGHVCVSWKWHTGHDIQLPIIVTPA